MAQLRTGFAGGAWSDRRLLRRTLEAYIFLLPFAILFLVTRIYPVIAGFYISLFRQDILGLERQFVGVWNYAQMPADPIFRQAVVNTVQFVLLSVPAIVVISMAFAVALKENSRIAAVLRAAIFAPRLLSVTVVSLTWLWLLEPRWGLLNYYLTRLGLPSQSWLADVRWAMPAIAVAYVWWWIGFSMVILVAGLQQIPLDLYEAASLDGAGPWASFRHITLPGLRRSLVFVGITQVISSFQMFALVYVMTGGGPAGATRTLVQYVYESGFRHYAMGYASALAYLLFAAIFVFTLLQLKGMRAWEEG